MPAFILLSGGILAFAVTYELLALQYRPAALVALFWSLPVSQQISWIVIGLAPIALMLSALVQHCRLIARRKSIALAQFSEIESIHRDITGLFVRLNQAQRLPRELDTGGRVVSLNG